MQLALNMNNVIRKKKIDSNHIFVPSMKFVSRVMKVILEKNSIGRTTLSQEANINYSTLSECIEWLEKKSLVELIIENGKVNVKLTAVGRDFASQLQKLTL